MPRPRTEKFCDNAASRGEAGATFAMDDRQPAPSIRVVVAVATIVPVLAVAAGLVTLSTLAARDIAESLGAEVVSAATAKAQAEIEGFIRVAEELSALNSSRIARGDLPIDDLRSWTRPLLDQMEAFDEVSFLVFANAKGDTIAAERDPQGLLIGVRDDSTDGRMIESALDGTGSLLAPPVRTFEFDPATRPWHQLATRTPNPAWTNAYIFAGRAGSGAETGISYARTVADAQGRFLGVLAVDVTLGDLSLYLESLSIATTGAIFIVDRENLLVAASEGGLTAGEGARLSLADSPSPSAQAVATALRNGGAGTPSIDSPLLKRVAVEGEPARALVTPFHPSPGIDWRIVAVLPEQAFLSRTQTVQHRLIGFSLLGAAVVVVVAVWLSQRIAKPILELRRFVRHVGEGAFGARLDLRAAREFEDLSHDLNEMASQLRQRMALQQSLDLARQVQQSLLPKEPPTPPGLDLAGHSQYCDSTGGDYFDFIDAAPAKGRDGSPTALLAIGDVMGHGVASALLMASARAALRIQAQDESTLGAMLARVNTVLLQDTAHGRFMTMMLLMLNPAARRIRYANAGHDAAILFDPATRRFSELEGGGIPLGVDAGTSYDEYSRENVPPGTVVVAGTDGIWEMRNDRGEFFGKATLRRIIEANAHEPAQRILDRIRESLVRHRGSARIQDDVTLVVAKFSGAGGAGTSHRPDAGQSVSLGAEQAKGDGQA
ncbi:MAG: SpoIIE family protein phosphatase [Phycisphaerales bacterium]|nr:SpoIIE family protein phosphatase [Phycisphaerales bacterium]